MENARFGRSARGMVKISHKRNSTQMSTRTKTTLAAPQPYGNHPVTGYSTEQACPCLHHTHSIISWALTLRSPYASPHTLITPVQEHSLHQSYGLDISYKGRRCDRGTVVCSRCSAWQAPSSSRSSPSASLVGCRARKLSRPLTRAPACPTSARSPTRYVAKIKLIGRVGLVRSATQHNVTSCAPWEGHTACRAASSG